MKFAFEPKASRSFGELARLNGNELQFLRELRARESVFSELTGYGDTASDYDFRIENHKTGAGVRIQGSQPLVRLVFWSIRTTRCPEPYIRMRIEPGRQSTWRIAYEFYTIPR